MKNGKESQWKKTERASGLKTLFFMLCKFIRWSVGSECTHPSFRSNSGGKERSITISERGRIFETSPTGSSIRRFYANFPPLANVAGGKKIFLDRLSYIFRYTAHLFFFDPSGCERLFVSLFFSSYFLGEIHDVEKRWGKRRSRVVMYALR